MIYTFYIIEHPTRGTYKDADWTDAKIPQPRFSVSRSRVDENVRRFFHIAQAKRELAKFPPKLRQQCQIRQGPDWEVVS